LDVEQHGPDFDGALAVSQSEQRECGKEQAWHDDRFDADDLIAAPGPACE
jgi:hypothetical protein